MRRQVLAELFGEADERAREVVLARLDERPGAEAHPLQHLPGSAKTITPTAPASSGPTPPGASPQQLDTLRPAARPAGMATVVSRASTASANSRAAPRPSAGVDPHTDRRARAHRPAVRTCRGSACTRSRDRARAAGPRRHAARYFGRARRRRLRVRSPPAKLMTSSAHGTAAGLAAGQHPGQPAGEPAGVAQRRQVERDAGDRLAPC